MGSSPARCRNGSRFFFHLLVFIFAATLLGVGNMIRHDNAANKVSVPGSLIRGTLCRLKEREITQLDNGAYIAVWRRDMSGNGPNMVVVNPFAVRKTVEQASRDLDSYGNATYNCACMRLTAPNNLYPNIDSSLRNTCMLEEDTTEYVRHIGWLYGYSGDAALASGAFLLVIFLCLVIILMIDVGFCCCYTSRNVEIPYREADKDGFNGGKL
jgi:hypothetical protein